MLQIMGKAAKKAKYEVEQLSTESKNEILLMVASGLEADQDSILTANQKDMEEGRKKGLSEGLLDRLLLTKERIKDFKEYKKYLDDEELIELVNKY